MQIPYYQTNEPQMEKGHVKISTRAKFQNTWPNTREMEDTWKPPKQGAPMRHIQEKRLGCPPHHLSYFRVFQFGSKFLET